MKNRIPTHALPFTNLRIRSQLPSYDEWFTELQSLARKHRLDWLLCDEEFREHWADGETPQELIQAIYDDVGCPIEIKD